MQHIPLEERGESHTGHVLASQRALDASAWVSCPHIFCNIPFSTAKEEKARATVKVKQHKLTPAPSLGLVLSCLGCLVLDLL